MGNGEAEKADGKCRMANDRWRNDGCEVRSGGYGNGQSDETTPQGSQSPIVGYDSNRVIDDSTNDKSESCRTRECTRQTDRTRARRPAEPAFRREDARKCAKQSQSGINAKLVTACG